MCNMEELLIKLEAYRRKAILSDKKAIEFILNINSLSTIIYALKVNMSIDNALNEETESRKQLLDDRNNRKER